MAKYKIKVNVELLECDESINSEPMKHDNGNFTMTISEQDAISIDKCESSVLRTAYPTIRDAISSHLTVISKKKAEEISSQKEVIANPHSYQVDGEVGRFTFITHSVLHDGQNQYNTGREVFAELKGIEFYRTTGFKEIAMIYGDTDKSYRKTTQLINRIRHQEQNGTPSRTLHESTEREGTGLLDHIEEKSKCILEENGFSKDGIYQERKTEYANDQPVIIAEKDVAVAIETCREYCNFPDDILNNPVAYEDPKESINIAIDDVIRTKRPLGGLNRK